MAAYITTCQLLMHIHAPTASVLNGNFTYQTTEHSELPLSFLCRNPYFTYSVTLPFSSGGLKRVNCAEINITIMPEDTIFLPTKEKLAANMLNLKL